MKYKKKEKLNTPNNLGVNNIMVLSNPHEDLYIYRFWGIFHLPKNQI